jgi:hypothetical protein
MTENSNQLQKALFSDTLLLAGISFYGYCLSMSFEAGYNTYFKIPLYFIPFDLSSILFSIFLVIGAIFSFLTLVRAASQLGFMKEVSELLGRAILIFIIIVLFVFFVLFLLRPAVEVWLGTFLGIIVLALLLFASPLLGKKEGMTYREAFLSRISKNNEFNKQDPIFRLLDRFSKNQQLSVIALIVILFFAFAVGYSNAKGSTIFETISTTPKMVILQFVGENFLASPYDENNHKLNGQLFLISEQEVSQNSYYLTQENIGKLIP